jgi:hypothetical protein
MSDEPSIDGDLVSVFRYPPGVRSHGGPGASDLGGNRLHHRWARHCPEPLSGPGRCAGESRSRPGRQARQIIAEYETADTSVELDEEEQNL